jgi:hypothetical protein
VGDRGWAGELLSWSWRGVQLEAEVSRARYFIRAGRHEVVAWCEVREACGRCRSFRSVGEARAACERDAGRRGPTKNAKTSQSVAQTARQRAAMVRFKRCV